MQKKPSAPAPAVGASSPPPDRQGFSLHFEKMLGEARMVVWRWDPENDRGIASRLTDELWGLLPGQSLSDSGMGFSLIHPEDVDRHREIVEGATAQGGGWHNEFRIIRPRDGRIAWLEERAHATRDAATGKVFIEGVTWDITERKKAELARGASEQKYRTLFDSIDEGFAIWKVLYDDAGHPLDALLLEGNARFKALPGHAEAVGKTSRQLFPDADNWWIDIFQEVLAGGAPMRLERYLEPVGRWLDVHLTPLGPSLPGQVAVVFTDSTDRRQAAEMLLESESRNDFLVRLEDALRPLHEVTAIQETACRLLADKLDADRVYYSRLDEENAVAEIRPEYHRPGLPGLSGRYPLDVYAEPLKTLYRGEVFTVSDTADAPDLPPETVAAFRALGAASVLCVPLMKEGKLAWALGVLAQRPRAWNVLEMTLAREVAERTWSAVGRAEAESALRTSEQRYRTLFDSIDEGFALIEVLFDDAGRPVDVLYLKTNPAFVRHVGQAMQGKRLKEIVPNLEPVWLESYGHVALTGEPLRMEQPVAGLDRWFRVSAFRQGGPESRQVGVLLENITESRSAAAALRESEARKGFLVGLEDALRPLEDPATIQATATRLLGKQLGVDRVYYADIHDEEGFAEIHPGYNRPGLPSIAGRYGLNLLTEPLRPLRIGHVLDIADTRGATDLPPNVLQAFRAWGAASVLSYPLIKDGRLSWALSILHGEPRTWTEWEIGLVRETAERTWAAAQRADAEEALRHSREKYRTLFESIDEGFCIIELIFDDAGNPVDLFYVETNPAFVRHTGLDLRGRRVREAIPDYEQFWLDHYARALRTGEIVRLEHPVKGLDDRWFRVSAFPHGNPAERRLGVVFANITESKKAEIALKDFNVRLEREVHLRTAQLHESRDLLQSVLNTSLVGISLLQAVRDAGGRVVDFRIRLINDQLRLETGREDLVGKLYAEEFPGIKAVGLFEVMVGVMESGKPAGLEYFFPHEGFKKWFSSMFVRFEDNLVATNLDITERKRGEDALQEALNALSMRDQMHGYGEEIGEMGTWTWNTRTNITVFSDNMYRLFQLPPDGVEPTPETIVRFIHPDDRARVLAGAERLRREGQRAVPVEYRVTRDDGSERIFQNRVRKVADTEGGHILVGITQDVTELRREEERNRELRQERHLLEERQRMDLLTAALTAQEEERRRIAESLHNGIGQMLYGIQLNLNLLDLKPGDTWEGRHARQQRRSTRLLSEAIEETRRVSHELMPSVLEDFGLKMAVEELCRQFNGKLNVDCMQANLPDTIPQYISIALYRSLQELMTNIVKHAEASRVKISLAHAENVYELEVTDDGMGFDAGKLAAGIGLKSLREKIALLKGEFHLDSGDAGTRIRVRIPHSPSLDG